MLCTRQVHVGTTTLLYTKTNLQISDRAKNLINNKKASVIYSPELFVYVMVMRDALSTVPYEVNLLIKLKLYFISRFQTPHPPLKRSPFPSRGRLISSRAPHPTFWRAGKPRPYGTQHRRTFCGRAMLAPATHIKKRALRLSFLLRILNYSFTYALTYVN